MTKTAKTRTLVELAADALALQDACNLSGVVFSFAKAMEHLCELVPNTNERNTHPIVVLWADKIASLCRVQDVGNDNAMRAFDECYRLIGGRK